MPAEMISRINSDQSAYDQNPDYFDRLQQEAELQWQAEAQAMEEAQRQAQQDAEAEAKAEYMQWWQEWE